MRGRVPLGMICLGNKDGKTLDGRFRQERARTMWKFGSCISFSCVKRLSCGQVQSQAKTGS